MKELSIKEALEYRKSNKLKIGDNCLSIDTFEGDKYVDCPYREQNCQNKICAKYMAHLDVNDDKIVQKEIKDMGFDMNNMQMFELLMSMQSLFAEKFHKVKGLSKEEQDKFINMYLVCIEDEVREVREHLNIYPDIKAHTNKVEMKKEIIDILHFMMDTFICGNANFKDIEKYYLNEFSPLVSQVNSLFAYAIYNQTNELHKNYDGFGYDETNLLLVNRLLDCSAEIRQCISWKHWKKPSDHIDYDKLYTAFAHMFKIFIDICIINEMNEDEIKEIYIKKNLENRRRQVWNY